VSLLSAIRATFLSESWPPKQVADQWAEIELFAAFRSSDKVRIRQEASVGVQYPYMLSPVPRMISRASAHLLFGEPAKFTAAAERDQENLDRIVTENDLVAECHRAAVIASSEGSVWGRIVVDPTLIDTPIIEFVSPGRVIPHFAGRFVVGATFVTEWATSSTERFRMFETYEAGMVTTQLRRGTRSAVGHQVDLDSFPETEGRSEVVYTGVDWPLVAFIPNTIDADPTCGYSDYAGLRDRFLALNESVTVGQANLRLAGRKRAIIDAGYVGTESGKEGKLPSGEDIFIRTSRTGGDGEKTSPLQVIDYSFDATGVTDWIDHLIDSTLTFAGVAPQAVGRSIDGGAVSGTALKLKMTHSLLESSGKGRYFDRGLIRLLRGAQILDSRPMAEGGFGRSYAEADSNGTVERAQALPRDDVEAAQQLVALSNAEAISTEEKVAFLHPTWSQERIEEEVARLQPADLGMPSLTPTFPQFSPSEA
jgi:hypothetical protein